MENLSAEVERVFRSCLFTEEEVIAMGADELKQHCVRADGIMHAVGFHPARVKQYEAEIRSFVDEMRTEFFVESGGGWTFLNLCTDKHDVQWTDLHQRMEQLVQLAIAAKMGRWCMPRSMWPMLPGGMPYVVFSKGEMLPAIFPSEETKPDVQG